jgi:outer membrane protein
MKGDEVVRIRAAVSAIVFLAGAARAVAAQDSSAAPVVVTVTLGEAIRRAIDVQPLMVAARGEARNAGAGVRAATGAFLPSITTGGSATRRGGSNINTSNEIVSAPTISSYSGNLTLTLPIFDGFQRIADRKAASATEAAADAGLINQRFQVMLDTKRTFYQALATEELVRVAEAQVRRTQQQLQISVEKLRAGSATRSDSLRSTVEYGDARIALLQAQAAFATAQANLGRQVGVEGPVRAVRDSDMPAFPDTTGLRATVMETAPSVVQAAAQARAATAQVTASRADYFPTFNTTVSGGYSGADWPWGTSPQYYDNWSLRLGVSWTLFDGFTRERALTNANVRRDNAQAEAADARRAASASLTEQLAAVATAFEQIDIARSSLAAATEDLRVQTERYRVGAATILELLTSQAALTQSEVSFIQRRFDYVVARATLEALIGREL